MTRHAWYRACPVMIASTGIAEVTGADARDLGGPVRIAPADPIHVTERTTFEPSADGGADNASALFWTTRLSDRTLVQFALYRGG